MGTTHSCPETVEKLHTHQYTQIENSSAFTNIWTQRQLSQLVLSSKGTKVLLWKGHKGKGNAKVICVRVMSCLPAEAVTH